MSKKIAIIILSIIVVVSSVLTPYYVTTSKRFEEELAVANEELVSTQSVLEETKSTLETTNNKLKTEIEKSEGLSKSLGEISKELKEANMTIEELKSDEYEFVYIGDFKLTHYCVEKFNHICGVGDGLTALGGQIEVGTTIAVDPTVVPYGTQVYIEGYGLRVAQDCGGWVKDNHIDVAVETHDQAMSMGTNYGGVWVLKKKT